MTPDAPDQDDDRGLWKRGEDRLERYMGGPTRVHIVLILACVLGLDTSDKAALAAVAGSLKHYFGIGNTEIGLLVSVVLFAGAAATLPVGLLTDRINRTRLLAVTIGLWSVALVASGAATSYPFLLGTRVVLGGVTATANPTIASLVGDYFDAANRGRIYGMILAGELAGTGFGFVISGLIGDQVSWRWAFWVLAAPGAVVAWLVWRKLPEPARGGARQLGPEDSVPTAEIPGPSSGRAAVNEPESEAETARRIAREHHIEPVPDMILHEDPRDRSLWWAIKYVLRIRTNVVLIAGSMLVYFYFSGLRAFAIIFMDQHYGIGSGLATALVVVAGVGAIAGVYAGGRVGDVLIRRGRFNGRILVGIVVLALTIVFFVPALLSTTLWIGIPALTGASFFLSAANPPADAARLDIMHPSLWGRAESVRVFLRKLGEAAAPTMFGWMSESVFGGPAGHGLQKTLLVMLASVVVAALVLLLALGSYGRDVATAAASVDETLRRGKESPRPRMA